MKNRNLSGSLFTKQALTIKETPLSSTIAEYLTIHRIYNDRLNSGKVEVIKRYFCKKANTWKEFRNWLHLCSEGTPDRFAIVEGQIIFIEVKQLGKQPTPEQITKHTELKKSGAMVIVADSFESFERQFTEARKSIAAN